MSKSDKVKKKRPQDRVKPVTEGGFVEATRPQLPEDLKIKPDEYKSALSVFLLAEQHIATLVRAFDLAQRVEEDDVEAEDMDRLGDYDSDFTLGDLAQFGWPDVKKFLSRLGGMDARGIENGARSLMYYAHGAEELEISETLEEELPFTINTLVTRLRHLHKMTPEQREQFHHAVIEALDKQSARVDTDYAQLEELLPPEYKEYAPVVYVANCLGQRRVEPVYELRDLLSGFEVDGDRVVGATSYFAKYNMESFAAAPRLPFMAECNDKAHERFRLAYEGLIKKRDNISSAGDRSILDQVEMAMSAMSSDPVAFDYDVLKKADAALQNIFAPHKIQQHFRQCKTLETGVHKNAAEQNAVLALCRDTYNDTWAQIVNTSHHYQSYFAGDSAKLLEKLRKDGAVAPNEQLVDLVLGLEYAKSTLASHVKEITEAKEHWPQALDEARAKNEKSAAGRNLERGFCDDVKASFDNALEVSSGLIANIDAALGDIKDQIPQDALAHMLTRHFAHDLEKLATRSGARKVWFQAQGHGNGAALAEGSSDS